MPGDGGVLVGQQLLSSFAIYPNPLLAGSSPPSPNGSLCLEIVPTSSLTSRSVARLEFPMQWNLTNLSQAIAASASAVLDGMQAFDLNVTRLRVQRVEDDTLVTTPPPYPWTWLLDVELTYSAASPRPAGLAGVLCLPAIHAPSQSGEYQLRVSITNATGYVLEVGTLDQALLVSTHELHELRMALPPTEAPLLTTASHPLANWTLTFTVPWSLSPVATLEVQFTQEWDLSGLLPGDVVVNATSVNLSNSSYAIQPRAFRRETFEKGITISLSRPLVSESTISISFSGAPLPAPQLSGFYQLWVKCYDTQGTCHKMRRIEPCCARSPDSRWPTCRAAGLPAPSQLELIGSSTCE